MANGDYRFYAPNTRQSIGATPSLNGYQQGSNRRQRRDATRSRGQVSNPDFGSCTARDLWCLFKTLSRMRSSAPPGYQLLNPDPFHGMTTESESTNSVNGTISQAGGAALGRRGDSQRYLSPSSVEQAHGNAQRRRSTAP